MKKVFLTALVAVFGLAGTAHAQFSAGTVAVGGGISFSVENTKEKNGTVTKEDDPYTRFELSPSVGYFIADDLEVGAQVSYNRSGVSGDNYSVTSNMFAVGPYVRKYFSFGETVALFGEAGLAIGSGKTTSQEGSITSEDDKYSVFSVGITPGFVFRPVERLGVELSAGFLGYTSIKQEEGKDYEETTSEFGLSFDMSDVSLGLKLYF